MLKGNNMISSEDIETIVAAVALNEKGPDFYEQVDELLTPICLKAIDFDAADDIEKVVSMLPPGFHRTELRTFMYLKREDEEKKGK